MWTLLENSIDLIEDRVLSKSKVFEWDALNMWNRIDRTFFFLMLSSNILSDRRILDKEGKHNEPSIKTILGTVWRQFNIQLIIASFDLINTEENKS